MDTLTYSLAIEGDIPFIRNVYNENIEKLHNLPARALYLSAGYTVTEIGPCTTADGIERVGYTFQKEI